MIEAISAFEGRMAKIVGPVRSGKTEALVRRAAALVAGGTAPQDILVACATAEAARVARLRIERALADAGVECAAQAAQAMAVTSVKETCLAVLSPEAAQEATGRIPRLLAPFEHNFFLEDMKTTGLPNRRLRGLLNRFSQKWCANESEGDWAVPGDEADALALAHSLMDAYGAMLEDEVAYVASRYLQSEAGAGAAHRFHAVLCDDYQNASAAQQQCLCLLARDQLMVAGNPNETVACATAWPCAEGFAKFDALRHGVETFTLDVAFGNPNVSAFCDALVDEPGMDPSLSASTREGTVRDIALLKWNTPDEEFNGLTRYLLSCAESDGAPAEDDICLVAPNRTWAKALEQLLKHRGFAVSSLGFGTLGGDPRTLGRCRASQAYTALNLLANPEDAMAWRIWCGYGNYLTNSDAWAALRAWMAERNLSTLAALKEACEAVNGGHPEPFLRAAALAERWNAAQELFGQAQGRRGFALLAAVGAQKLPEFEAVAGAMAGDEDAAALFALVRASQFSPTHSQNAHAVRLSSYDQMVGCTYAAVYLAGCVDGFIPVRDAFEVVSTEEDRQRLMEEGRRRFMGAAGKAAATLTFSAFSTADLELAERTKMRVMRVRMGEEGRVALVRPTAYIQEAGGAAPITLGGQALLKSLE